MGANDHHYNQHQKEYQIPFPFQPYPSQQALMQQLCRTFERGNIGLFESPTGTGKSLSLICASLAWLRDHQKRQDAGENVDVSRSATQEDNSTSVPTAASDEPDWLRDYSVSKKEEEENHRRARIRERRENLRRRLVDSRSQRLISAIPSSSTKDKENVKTQMKQSKSQSSQQEEDDGSKPADQVEEEEEDDDLLPADYESGREGGGEESDEENIWSDSDSDGEEGASSRKKDKKTKKRGLNGGRPQRQKEGGEDDDIDEEEEDDEGEELDRSTTKILYCSRTHSQVSQFVMEIEKTAYQEDARVISLSSRKNLCINEDVLKLGSDTRISDRCLDMQKGKAKGSISTTVEGHAATVMNDQGLALKRQKVQKKQKATKTTKCPYLQIQHSTSVQQQGLYRDHALNRVRNLEDLADVGKKLGTCAYYGTRRAVAQAEIICMPYATLLCKGTRGSMKIPLKGNVVLIDEAHNLIEAINAVHTSYLSLPAMSRALSQVTLYWERYNTRLSGKNGFYVQQVIRILKGMVDFLHKKVQAATGIAAAAAASSSSKAKGRGGGGGRARGGIGKQSSVADDSLSSSSVMSVNELLFEAGMDHINLFKTVRYMEQSQIAKKVLGFAERRLAEVQIHPVVRSSSSRMSSQGPSTSSSTSDLFAQEGGDEGEEGPSTSTSSTTTNKTNVMNAVEAGGGGGGPDGEYVSSHVSSLQVVQSFLTTLTGSNQDGRIVLETGTGAQKGRRRTSAGLKYIMLNAAVHFKDIVQEARSVILIGGTLQPVAPIVSQLFPDLPPHRIDIFSCGHVIPPENLSVLSLTKGPSGVDFDFTHKSRTSPTQMDELGRLLLNVCTVSPSGVVAFLPSYQYEEILFRRWRETGILSKLESKKTIFNEPKNAKDVDSVLQAYAKAIAHGQQQQQQQGGGSGSSKQQGGTANGALLFCVVGAKMSEGINFANEMARCVVMIGLPYPDRRDPELQQKLKYLDGLKSQSSAVFGSVSGRAYYQNLCMRAVNQSIGRAIRHANDWAAIILVDRRYFSDSSIMPLLPKWISSRVVPYQHSADFGRAFVNLTRFFRSKLIISGSSYNSLDIVDG